MTLVHNWNNKAVLPQSKINGLCKSVMHMISKEMVVILNDLKKEHDVKTLSGEFKGLFADAVFNPIVCWEHNGDKIEAKLDQVTGGMNPRDLKKEMNSSILGRLNHYVAVMQCYIKEEMEARCAPPMRYAPPAVTLASSVLNACLSCVCTAGEISSRTVSNSLL